MLRGYNGRFLRCSTGSGSLVLAGGASRDYFRCGSCHGRQNNGGTFRRLRCCRRSSCLTSAGRTSTRRYVSRRLHGGSQCGPLSLLRRPTWNSGGRCSSWNCWRYELDSAADWGNEREITRNRFILNFHVDFKRLIYQVSLQNV